MGSALTPLLEMLPLLPRNVNRYTVTVVALQAKIVWHLDPRPRPLMFVFSALLGIAFILAIVGMFFRLRSGTFRLFTVSSGLIIPQATLMFAFWMSIFCVVEVGSLVGLQTWSDRKKPLPPILAFLMGTLWLTVYLAVGPWLWSIAASSIRAKIRSGNSGASNMLPKAIGKAAEKNNYRRSVIFLNYYAIAIHVILIPTQITIFYYAAKSWSQGLSMFLEVIADLQAASSSYDPSTFSVNVDLVPRLASLVEAQEHTDRFFHLYAVGFGVWVGYNFVFLFAGLSPFFYSHIKQLILLSKSSPSLPVSMSEITGPASTFRDPTTSVAKPSTRQAGLASRQADYRTLLMASGVVYTIGLMITIIAIVVAVNPDFVVDPVKGAIFIYLAAGMFALFTPFVMAIFAWKSYIAYREAQRLKHPAPENLNHFSLSHQHASVALPRRIQYDRSEETHIQGENGIVSYALTSYEAKQLSVVGMDTEKDAPELQVERKLGKDGAEKENSPVRLTMGWNEAVWQAAPEARGR